MSCPIYPSLPVDFLTLRYHRLVICKPQCLYPSSSDLYPLLQILYRFAYKLFYIHVSGETGHPCLTPLPTFPGSEYSPSILTCICCPMYRFPISILSLQSIRRWFFSLMASSNIFLG